MGSLPQLSILRGPVRRDPSLNKTTLLHRLFEGAVSKNADKAAVHSNGATTFSQLDAAASRIARAIIARVRDSPTNSDGDSLVAVSLPPGLPLIETLLAIWKAGAAYLPLDAAFPPGRVKHILNEARPLLVICDQSIDTEPFGDTPWVRYSELRKASGVLASAPLTDAETLPAKEDELPLALVLYTSGSTGVPKGVRLPHLTVLNRLRWQWHEFPYSATEAACAFKTALTFVDSVAELWGPLLQGRAVVVLPKDVTADPERLVEALERYQVERLVLVPSLLRAILTSLGMCGQRDGPALPRLRLWVSSGEPLPPTLATRFFAVLGDGRLLCNLYGSTEVMGDVTYHVLRSAADLNGLEKVPIGVPLDNCLVYLLDAQMRPAPEGATAELFVAGANVAAGYVAGRDPHRFLRNPLTVDPEYGRLFRTGDYAMVEKGVMRFEGRTDSQVKVRGHRVDLAEVESALARLSAVDKAVVLCHHPGAEDQQVVAFVVPALPDATPSAVEDALADALPAYAIPHVVLIKSVPLLVNGKVDRQELLRRYADTTALRIDYTGADADCGCSRLLLDTVAEVLGSSARAPVALMSSFYQLGGNSLNSVLTVSLLRERGFHIGIADFVSAESLAQVAERMSPLGAVADTDVADTAVAAAEAAGFHIEPMSDRYKDDVYQMITDSFLRKADLERWLRPGVRGVDYVDVLDSIWTPLIDAGLSFVVLDAAGNTAAVALSFDAHDEPPVDLRPGNLLGIVFAFLEFLEGPVRDQQLPGGRGSVLHSFMMATASTLTPQENVFAMSLMEREVLRIARRDGFHGVLTTNTSPLTQQLGADVFGYATLLDYQVNRYVAGDGSRPFEPAPDDQRAYVAWKPMCSVFVFVADDPQVVEIFHRYKKVFS